MAAVICRGISQLCEGIGSVACLPCKTCGFACQGLGEIISSPFFPYLALTVGLNIASVLMGARAIPELGSCSSGSKWLVLNAALSACHIIAAWYLTRKIQEHESLSDSPQQANAVVVGGETASKVESGTYYPADYGAGRESTEHNSMERVRHLMCEDKWMALYILIGIGWMVWQVVGVQTWFAANEDECANVQGWITIALACGWLYFVLGAFGFACSICCMQIRG